MVKNSQPDSQPYSSTDQGQEAQEEGAPISEFSVDTVSVDDFVIRQMEALRKYAPETAQIMFNLYKQFAPQYTKVQKDVVSELYPDESKLIPELSKQVLEKLTTGQYQLSPVLENLYKRNAREAFSDRGLVNSGMAGRAEAEVLTGLAMQDWANAANLALNINSTLPKVNIPSNIPGSGGPEVNDYFSSLLSANVQAELFGAEMAFDDYWKREDMNFQDYWKMKEYELDKEKIELEKDRIDAEEDTAWGEVIGIGVGTVFGS